MTGRHDHALPADTALVFFFGGVDSDCSDLATLWLHRIGYLREWPLDGAKLLIYLEARAGVEPTYTDLQSGA